MSGVTEEFIQGSAGKLFTRAWHPTGAPRAIVAICHGFNAHSGAYDWCGDQFAEKDIACYALDLRGRGRSEGERFFVERFEEYVDDLRKLIVLAKSRAPHVPTFLLGHSAGGVTGCLFALEHPSEIAGFICEDFAFEVPAPDIALAVLKGLSHIAPHAHALALKNEDFSKDPAVLQSMNEDPLIANERQPFATMAAIVRADEQLRQSFRQIKMPMLIIHGDADRAAKLSGSRRFYADAGSVDKTIVVYEGRYHDPLRDIGKEEVFSDILNWIEARLPVEGPSTAEGDDTRNGTPPWI